MKRWLSFVKRHVTPGTWVKPAKKRRPLTYAPPTLVRDSFVNVTTDTTQPLRPRPRTLCDPLIILERYQNAPSIARASSQALPLCDIAMAREAFCTYAFIDFEPTYVVSVSEMNPYQIALRKPRPARFSTRVVSFFKEMRDGEVRSGPAVYAEE